MKMTLDAAEKWLRELGIEVVQFNSTQLAVSRADVENLGSSFAELLEALRVALSTARIVLDGQSDKYYYLGVY